MAYWIIKSEYIKGSGNNSHIFKDDSITSICGNVEHKNDAKGTKYEIQKDLKEAISKSGRELCAKCSGFSTHTDL